MYSDDFLLPDGTYLLSHSVGRPLKTSQQFFTDHFFEPWQTSHGDPWQQWLTQIDSFRTALGLLFHSSMSNFCPQVNLSSALSKVVMSLASLQVSRPRIVMSEQDFPSMGFVLQKALPHQACITYIPKHLNITDPNVWAEYVNNNTDLVFISHAYSNTGQRAPIEHIVTLAHEHNAVSVVDVAQSAGVIPLHLNALKPDFLIGSSVKWLCGGPGAAYLWVNPDILSLCTPKDVGWFSHENPFEFDIHHFQYQDNALRFWGGTPSIAPYVIASNSIMYLSQIGADKIRKHNQTLINMITNEFSHEVASPTLEAKRSGTVVLNFKQRQPHITAALAQQRISIDERSHGIRISPHIYNNASDIKSLINVIKHHYK